MTDFLKLEDFALNVASEVIRMAKGVSGPLKTVAAQSIRSGSGVALQIAEGAGRTNRSRKHLYEVAYGSAIETTYALKLLVAADEVDAQEAETVLANLDRVRKLLWSRMHPKA